MPAFEMPLEQLKSYGGRNPRPDDFDAYWDRALSELDATNPQPELVPHLSPARFAECFDLWFTGVGQARIHAQYVRPRSAGSHPAVLKFHGYSGSAGAWFELLPWAAQGMAIAALDVRGQGGLSEDVGGVAGTTLRGHIIRGLGGDPDKLLFRQIFLDTVQLARVVMSLPEVDPKRVGAMGASQGGGLTLACAGLESRIARAAPVYPFLCDYQRVWEMDLAVDAYEELTYYFKRFDPIHKHELEIFTTLGYIDVQHLAPRITANVLMTTALMDTVCPPSSQFAAYNKIKSPKEMVLYPDFGHDDLPGNDDRAFEFLGQL
ncbi:MAG TPA: acetylxylan esterase [Candidatus Acidoferrum sp.]|nr:acetylxylan esterase [Candidatus Acidoferrum sp.]